MPVAPKPVSKQEQIEEIIKCGKDPVYFMKKYCWIQHPARGLLKFETYPFQDDCIKQFLEHRLNIILKSRQLGLSTLCAAYATWLAIFYKDQNILIIATKNLALAKKANGGDRPSVCASVIHNPGRNSLSEIEMAFLAGQL